MTGKVLPVDIEGTKNPFRTSPLILESASMASNSKKRRGGTGSRNDQQLRSKEDESSTSKHSKSSSQGAPGSGLGGG
jgi:hypothetical protein